MMRVLVLAAVGAACAVAPLSAQAPELTPFAEAALSSRYGLGSRDDAPQWQGVGLRASWPIMTRAVSLHYVMEVLPVVRLGAPPEPPRLANQATAAPQPEDGQRFAAGVMPIGVELRLPFDPATRVTARALGGLVAANVRLPPISGREVNFAWRLSVGLEKVLLGQAVFGASLGWTHLSNAGTALQNPGLDLLVAQLGVTLRP
ncbi:MAG: acyloxyacyl hydrolase [Gemmatimonadales bacterium]|nr:acyloxyacyl hydrolase [Gemmatimonadales bacterium]